MSFGRGLSTLFVKHSSTKVPSAPQSDAIKPTNVPDTNAKTATTHNSVAANLAKPPAIEPARCENGVKLCVRSYDILRPRLPPLNFESPELDTGHSSSFLQDSSELFDVPSGTDADTLGDEHHLCHHDISAVHLQKVKTSQSAPRLSYPDIQKLAKKDDIATPSARALGQHNSKTFCLGDGQQDVSGKFPSRRIRETNTHSRFLRQSVSQPCVVHEPDDDCPQAENDQPKHFSVVPAMNSRPSDLSVIWKVVFDNDMKAVIGDHILKSRLSSYIEISQPETGGPQLLEQEIVRMESASSAHKLLHEHEMSAKYNHIHEEQPRNLEAPVFSPSLLHETRPTKLESSIDGGSVVLKEASEELESASENVTTNSATISLGHTMGRETRTPEQPEVGEQYEEPDSNSDLVHEAVLKDAASLERSLKAELSQEQESGDSDTCSANEDTCISVNSTHFATEHRDAALYQTSALSDRDEAQSRLLHNATVVERSEQVEKKQQVKTHDQETQKPVVPKLKDPLCEHDEEEYQQKIKLRKRMYDLSMFGRDVSPELRNIHLGLD